MKIDSMMYRSPQ